MLVDVDQNRIETLMSGLRRVVRQGTTLREVAQDLMEQIHRGLSDSIVLARVYATMSYESLPTRDKEYLESAAHDANSPDGFAPQTTILSLLGTAGAEAAWCDRDRSVGHLGIPILSPASVESTPMVAALIRQLGTTREWYKQVANSDRRADRFSVFTETFFVPDASQTRDPAGRLLIPAQDFVREHGIHSVFGVGGEFVSTGMILVCIFFSREQLKETPAWFLRVPLVIANAADLLVSAGSIF